MKVIDLDECWIYAGTKDKNGYGYLSVYLEGKSKTLRAHRASYESFVDSIPDGLVIDHLCRVTSCINPDHLEPVTSVVNTLRGMGFAGKNVRKKECPNGHPYDDDNAVRFGIKSYRRCRACENERHKAYYAANKEKWRLYNGY